VKPLIAILLISIIINTGYFFIYQILIFRAKWNATCLIQTRTPSLSTVTLTIAKKESKNFDEDELLYKGKLYDVIKKVTTPDSVTFFLYPDVDEQAALSALVNCFLSNNVNRVPQGDKISPFKSFHGIPDQLISQ
jgi:hypothetical protein